MIWLFLAREAGAEIDLVVEGDDSLVVTDGWEPTVADFERVGFAAKVERHEKIHTASFCGNVFDPDVGTLVTDVRKVLAEFFWLSGAYRLVKPRTAKALLRAKAWSLYYQYPGCPVISHLAWNVLRLTAGVHLDKIVSSRLLDEWARTKLKEAQKHTTVAQLKERPRVPDANRALVAELYGIDLDMQRWYESFFDGMTLETAIPCHFQVPKSWTDYADRYVSDVDIEYETPGVIWPTTHPVKMPIHVAVDQKRAPALLFEGDAESVNSSK